MLDMHVNRDETEPTENHQAVGGGANDSTSPDGPGLW
jgi:hypothetical protein